MTQIIDRLKPFQIESGVLDGTKTFQIGYDSSTGRLLTKNKGLQWVDSSGAVQSLYTTSISELATLEGDYQLTSFTFKTTKVVFDQDDLVTKDYVDSAVTGGSSDKFLEVGVTATLDIVINHNFGRLPNVKVFENGYEVTCSVSFSPLTKNTHIRIESEEPLTGLIILT